MKKKVISTSLKDLSKSNRLMLKILMQEIADVRRELKEDIHALDTKLSNKIDGVDEKLSGRIDKVSSELHLLRLEVHQNQTAFMRNHADLERRVTVLEAAA